MSHKTLKEAASQEAYLIHRMTDCGQDAAQNFMDTNPGLNIKKLTNDLMYNLVNRFEVRDVITGRAHDVIKKKFMKAYNTKNIKELKLTEASIDLYQELEPTLNDLYSKLNAIIKSTVDPKYKQAIQNLLNAYEAIENKMSQVTSKMGVVPVMEVKRFSDPTYPRDVVNTNGNIVTTREGKKYKVLTTKPKEGSKDFYFDTLMDRVEQLNPEDWDIDVRTYKKAIPVGTNEESKLKESHKLLTKLIRDAVEQAVTETADANDFVDYNSTIHKKLETGAADFELDPTNTIVYAFMPFEEEANVHVRVPFKKEYIEGFTEETISSQADLDRLSYDIGNYVRSVMRRPDKDQILKKVLKLN